jgi:hypothetical protein
MLQKLEDAGFLESKVDDDGDEMWQCTETGMNDLAMARFGKPMARAEAERLLEKALIQVQEYNSIKEFPYQIIEVRVFGSYLSDSPVLGDLDLWLLVEEKDDYKNKNGWELNYQKLNGKGGNLSIINQLLLPKNELADFIKQGSRKLSVHLQGMSEFTDLWKTVYIKDGKK